jgi:hypothetical protein
MLPFVAFETRRGCGEILLYDAPAVVVSLFYVTERGQLAVDVWLPCVQLNLPFELSI